jgi:quinol monooxygenase YgiN
VIVLMGSFRCPADKLDALRGPMAAVVSASRAEDGCLEYAYSEDLLDRGLVRISEVWRDQVALDRHFTQPHMDAWRAARALLGLAGRQLTLFEAGDGREI